MYNPCNCMISLVYPGGNVDLPSPGFDPCRAPCHLSDLDPVEAEQGKVFWPETAQKSGANEPVANFKQFHLIPSYSK